MFFSSFMKFYIPNMWTYLFQYSDIYMSNGNKTKHCTIFQPLSILDKSVHFHTLDPTVHVLSTSQYGHH